MKSLKRKSLRTNLLLLIIYAIAFIGFAGVAAPSLVLLLKGPADFDSLDFDENIDGQYVKATLYGIYDAYCEETTDGTVSAREYIIDAGESDYFMALRVASSGLDAAEALLDASIAYMDSKDDGTLLEEAQYEVTGTIHPISEDSLSFYHEYLDYDSMDAESQSYFLPYWLEVGDIGDNDTGDIVILMIFALLFLTLEVFLIVRLVSGKYQASVKKYIESSPNPASAAEKVETFLKDNEYQDELKANHNFVTGQNHGTTAFGETSQIAWIYKHVTTQKMYHILTIGRTYSAVLGFADGSRQTIAFKNQANADKAIATLTALCPKAIVGYTKELEQSFTKDLPHFLELKFNTEEWGGEQV